ncbi:MAG: ATP-binding protein, partial [Myxococcota bacterium]
LGAFLLQVWLVRLAGEGDASATAAVTNWPGLLAGVTLGATVGRLRDLTIRIREQAEEMHRHRERVAELEAARARSRREAAERLASLGTLAGGIAHEINNPLTFILGNLYVLRERVGSTDPQVRASLEEARVGAERVRDVVRALNAWTTGNDAAARAPVDVRRVMDEAMRLAGPTLHRAANVVRADEEAPPVLADASRLRQAFLNLLVNAAQAIPEGHAAQHEIRVTIRFDGERVRVQVTDTGRGMAPEVRARIFEPFFTTREVGAGTGLGLFAARGIVAGLGGDVEVETAPGAGSTFRVLLPPLEARPPAPAPAPPPAARPRVLIVDDDDLVTRSVAGLLEDDYEVTCETSGARAVARVVAGEPFDAVLCDLMMPDVDGIAFFEQVTRERPGVAPRLLFMTGGAFTPRAAEFLRRPDVMHVVKPFGPDVLLEAVAGRVAAGALARVPTV